MTRELSSQTKPSTENCNPYEPPRQLESIAAPAVRRFFQMLIPALVMASIGSAGSSQVVMKSGSTTASLLPAAVSLSMCLWFVCLRFAKTVTLTRIAVVIAGCLLSISAMGIYLDRPFFVLSSRYAQMAAAGVGGGTIFASSMVIARVVPFNPLLTFAACAMFSVAAFVAFVTFDLYRSPSNSGLCAFFCTTGFQAIVISTTALFMNGQDTDRTANGPGVSKFSGSKQVG